MLARRVITVAAALVAAVAGRASAQAKPAGAPAPAPVSTAERRYLLEVVGGIGSTIVDIDQWAGTTPLDWNTTNYSFTGRLFFLKMGKTRIGAEAAYQYLLWYSTVGGGSSAYHYESAPTRLAGIIRFPMGAKMSFDAGAGAYLFDSDTKVGAIAALGYHPRLSPRMTLPLQVRADYIFTDPSAIPVAFYAGIGYSF